MEVEALAVLALGVHRDPVEVGQLPRDERDSTVWPRLISACHRLNNSLKMLFRTINHVGLGTMQNPDQNAKSTGQHQDHCDCEQRDQPAQTGCLPGGNMIACLTWLFHVEHQCKPYAKCSSSSFTEKGALVSSLIVDGCVLPVQGMDGMRTTRRHDKP